MRDTQRQSARDLPYGELLAGRVRPQTAQTFLKRDLGTPQLSVTEIADRKPTELITPLAKIEDAFVAILHITAIENSRNWEGLRQSPVRTIPQGQILICELFLDHVMMAVTTHVAQTYGGLVAGSRQARWGLAGWQERRAKELLSAHLCGQIALQEVASACGLSKSHFSRAFRVSTGVSPHQWLLQRRVDAAKAAMLDSAMPLSEIALSCGFADQSHFTRVFSKVVGVSPGCWRRHSGIKYSHFLLARSSEEQEIER